MQERISFSKKMKKIKTEYVTMTFMRHAMIFHLSKTDPSERLKALSEVMKDCSQLKVFDEFFNGYFYTSQLKEKLDYICKIFDLLIQEDRKKLMHEHKYEKFHLLMFEILRSDELSETERVELTNRICQFLEDNMSPKELHKYFNGKSLKGKKYLDYAKKSGNQEVISKISELTLAKEMEGYILSVATFFQHAEKIPERQYFTSTVLRENKISTMERQTVITKGEAILKDLLEKKLGITLSAHQDQLDLTMFDRVLLSLHSKPTKTNKKAAYTLRCLSTEMGLYALGSGLLAYEDALLYAKNKTLEYFLANPDLPLLRLYQPDELVKLKDYQLWNVTGDYAFIALEKGLITNKLLSNKRNNKGLSEIFTHHGIIALQEKLIDAEDALELGEIVCVGNVLEELFTPNGVAALREGLYTMKQLRYVENTFDMKKMLQPTVLEQRRAELAGEKSACASH